MAVISGLLLPSFFHSRYAVGFFAFLGYALQKIKKSLSYSSPRLRGDRGVLLFKDEDEDEELSSGCACAIAGAMWPFHLLAAPLIPFCACISLRIACFSLSDSRRKLTYIPASSVVNFFAITVDHIFCMFRTSILAILASPAMLFGRPPFTHSCISRRKYAPTCWAVHEAVSI